MKTALKVTVLYLLLTGAGCRPPAAAGTHASGAVRIVSTAPALTEMVCAVGAADSLVGRTDACDFPLHIIGSVPVVGRYARPNLEQVIALRPSHLLESFLLNSAQAEMFEEIGIRIEHIECARIADIPAAARKIGRLTGHARQAGHLANEIERGLTQLTRQRGENNPRTLILLDHLTPVTCGTNTFISEMAALAGADNLATNLQKEYDNVSLEWIVEQQPELIICFYAIEGSPVEHFAGRVGWRDIPAVINRHIVVPEKLDLICRPGPRVIEGIEELRRSIAKTTAES
jgi:iron complex transport system substrate-binding protein